MTGLIAEMGEKLFSAHADAVFAAHPIRATDGAVGWLPDLWHDVQDAGLPFAMLSEEDGGFGIGPVEALGLVRQAAAHAAPVPIGETMLANWMLAAAGLPPCDGPLTIAAGFSAIAGPATVRMAGRATRIPFARHAEKLIVLARDSNGEYWIAALAGGWSIEPGHNLAGEPRDTVELDLEMPLAAVARSPISSDVFEALGATLRVQGMAGAMTTALSQTVAYVNERVQFGRAIGKFQAIQQNLAVMAGHVAATQAAADMAAETVAVALTNSRTFLVAVAAAKLRASEAATSVAEIAHQAHGAIGFSRECKLHMMTRRLWSWRDEFGSESVWQDRLGGMILGLGPDAIWPFLTGTDQERRPA